MTLPTTARVLCMCRCPDPLRPYLPLLQVFDALQKTVLSARDDPDTTHEKSVSAYLSKQS